MNTWQLYFVVAVVVASHDATPKARMVLAVLSVVMAVVTYVFR
jgi:uncharacterized membrane protein